MLLKPGKTYDEVYKSFQWEIPKFLNIGVEVCDKWAHQRYRLALIFEDENGRVEKYSFWDLKRLSNQLANALKAHGIARGDRVGVFLPQCVETSISHIAAFKIGAITVTLSTLLGPEAVEYRLSNSGAKGVITDGENLEKVLEAWKNLPDLKLVIVTKGQREEGVLDFWRLVEKGSADLEPVETRSDDPAFIIYTSGTTGFPKGAVMAHRDLLGHAAPMEFAMNFFPMDGDIVWSPSDWAWAQGLEDVLLNVLYHGITIVSHPSRKFDPEKAFHILSKYGIRVVVIPPTALKMMQDVKDAKSRYKCNVRSVATGASTLGEELLEWGREVLRGTINEMFGQTEHHITVSNCNAIMETRPGSVGRPAPGHRVEIINEGGEVLPAGTVGEVAVDRTSTVMFSEYWKDPVATKEKQLGDWSLTGDLAKKDEDGYFWFVSRKDEVIKSAGYRIGPWEIENCLQKHPAVAMSAVVGSPDEVRGTVIKAFIVLKPGISPSPSLEQELKDRVKYRYSAHLYPREIEFISELPMTTTGKIKRAELKKREEQRKLREKVD